MFGLFRKLVSGTIVDKQHYSYRLPSPSSIAAEGKHSGDFAESNIAFTVEPIPDTYSLIVDGVDKNGKSLRKEIDVDPGVWGSVSIGDKWPLT